MNNRIINIDSNEYQIIRKQIESDTFLVELDGNNIQNERQLFDVMEKAYNLHTLNGTWGKNWAAFDDLMTDLDWIGYDKYILTIFSFKSFMSKDLNGKRLFLEYFKESILPFWEEDVLHCVVEGKTKEFTVYLIE
jgi:hypothetical protein